MHLSDFLNESFDADLEKNLITYQNNKPYPHIIIDNFLQEEVAKQISEVFPKLDGDFWFQYDNPIEKKFATDDIRKFPPQIASLIHVLNSQEFVQKVEKLMGIGPLFSDPYLHGGGLHCTRKGGKLDIHLDYSIHPKLGLERRCNLILYLTPEWNEKWGGALQMWDKNMEKMEKKAEVKFNRAVIFTTDDTSYHGLPDPLDCPESITRNSIALYYLSKPRTEASTRPRALFKGRPQDPKDSKLDEFRKKRSEVSGIYKKTS